MTVTIHSTGRYHVLDDPLNTTEARYAALVDALANDPGVTHGPSDGVASKKAFGSSALKIANKIFAMVSSRGDFVVKLSRQRVDEIIASGDGERFDPGHGRLMKEWVVIFPTSQRDWLSLAREAMAFVESRR